MILNLPWASMGYIVVGCFILMFSIFMMNENSCEWKWLDVIVFCISMIIACIIIPALGVFESMGVI